MTSFAISEVNDFEKKLGGYSHLLNYRYMNLCVKADPVSLLPVTVVEGDEEHEIEDVADVAKSDDFHLVVIPKYPEVLKDINRGILEAHPEFKLSVGLLDDDNPESQFLICEMPEVDKDRRDFLNDAVKSLYEECKARMGEIKAEEKAGFNEIFDTHPQDLKEVNDAIDEAYDSAMNGIRALKDKKLDEIEEGYQRFLLANPQSLY